MKANGQGAVSAVQRSRPSGDTADRHLVEYETDHGKVKLSPGIVQNYLVNGQATITPQEMAMFINICKYQRLNPFLREVYLIKYSNNSPATIVTGKDAFLKRANRASGYKGFEAGIYILTQGSLGQRIGTLVLDDEQLVGGWAKIYRDGWDVPIEISVTLAEYLGTKNNGEVNSQWGKRPATMIRKVALVQALREAFPEEFGGLYDSSEMSVDESDMPEIPVEVERNEPEPPKAEKAESTQKEAKSEEKPTKSGETEEELF